MNRRTSQRLNSSGFAHWILPFFVVIAIVVVGVYVLHASQTISKKSATPTSTDVPSIGTHLPNIRGLHVGSTAVSPPTISNVSLTQQPIADEGWTGYSLAGPANAFTMAEATVTVPTITCPSATKPSQFSQWVGLDGFNGSSTVEQDGIRANCDEEPNNCITGQTGCTYSIQPDYYTWTEMYPGPVIAQSIPLKPGNVVHMEVWYDSSKGEFALSLHNESLGNAPNASSLQYSSCPTANGCVRSSAEWISENHVVDEGLLISTFGQASFSDAEASTSADLVAHPFTDWDNYPLYAQNAEGETLETVTAPLQEMTTSFTITQLHTD